MKTQREVILRYLKLGRRMTHMNALELVGCARLAARILELRQQGHDIKRRMRTVGGKTFAEYWI